MYKFVCVLDFEANCQENDPEFQNEVIEFPSVLLQYTGDNVLTKISQFQQYVKPVIHSKITKFCTELTGITQETVDKGCDFPTALSKYLEWLSTEIQDTCIEKNVLFVTCGDWDLRNMLDLQCKISKVDIPPAFGKWCNIKTLFQKFEGVQVRGMTTMLDQYKLKLEGKHHSGIDDCLNISRIVIEMFKKGCIICPTTERIGKKVLNMKLDYKTINYVVCVVSKEKKVLVKQSTIPSSSSNKKDLVQVHTMVAPVFFLPISSTISDFYKSIEVQCKNEKIKIKEISLYHKGKKFDSDKQIPFITAESIIWADNKSAHGFYNQIQQFIASDNETYEFPRMMNNIERRFIHALAEDYEIYSHSAGHDNGKDKKISISKKPFQIKKDNIPLGMSMIIYDHLYLGSGKDACDNDQLKSNEIKHVLNVTEEWRKPILKSVNFKRIPLKDQDHINIVECFDDAFEFIDHAKSKGERVLIHCVVGKSRSASFVVAYCMREYQMNLDKALDFVRQKRSFIKPNVGFMQQLKDYEGKLKLQ